MPYGIEKKERLRYANFLKCLVCFSCLYRDRAKIKIPEGKQARSSCLIFTEETQGVTTRKMNFTKVNNIVEGNRCIIYDSAYVF